MADVPSDPAVAAQWIMDRLYEAGSAGDGEAFRQAWETLTPEGQQVLYSEHPEMKALVDQNVWGFKKEIEWAAARNISVATDIVKVMREGVSANDIEIFRSGWDRLTPDAQRSFLDDAQVENMSGLFAHFVEKGFMV